MSSGPLLATEPTAGFTGYISHSDATSNASATTASTRCAASSLVTSPADNHSSIIEVLIGSGRRWCRPDKSLRIAGSASDPGEAPVNMVVDNTHAASSSAAGPFHHS